MEPVEAVITTIEEYTGIPLGTLRSQSRVRPIREARQLAIHFIHKHSMMTLSASARVLRRHHSTAIHSNKAVSNDFDTNKKYRQNYTFFNAVIINKINNV